MPDRESRRWWTKLLAAAAGALLAGCGSGAHAPASASKSHIAAHNNGKRDALDPDMVAAVASSKTSSRVVLKFALRQRPQIGQPTEVDVALIPQMPLDRVVESFYAEDGLTLREGGSSLTLEHPEPGTPIVHTLTVVPERDGIFYISATVLADSDTESVARTYTIPLIAGNGLAAPSHAAPAAAGAGPAVARVPLGDNDR
jgi:hypothetical protein